MVFYIFLFIFQLVVVTGTCTASLDPSKKITSLEVVFDPQPFLKKVFGKELREEEEEAEPTALETALEMSKEEIELNFVPEGKKIATL